MTSFRNFVRSTWIGRGLLLPWRLGLALRTTLKPVLQGVAWTFTSREHYNYTYDLQPINVEYLTAFLAVITGKDQPTIAGFIQEIAEDNQLKEHVARLTRASPERHVADTTVRFGRRMGWYALVRATRPRVVVETGVDKGLGSCVLAAALRRNAAEGFPGRLIGIDINPRAGYLLQPPYDQFGKLVCGDSLATLRALTEEVDLFIHDSDHTPEFESQEYEAVTPRLSARALVVSDNADHTDRLLAWTRQTGRQFLFFGEKPQGHWWPGEGIGVAFQRTQP